MSEILNKPKINDEIVTEVRKAFEHRATWMFHLMDEARQRGLDWDDFARKAIYRTGCMHGRRFVEIVRDKSELEQFAKVFAVGMARKVFEIEVLEENQEKYYLDFHYCPMVNAWQMLNLSTEVIEHLCDIGMDGDRGIASQFPDFEFTLGTTIAQGHPVCQVRFDKKRNEDK